jgi:hypothetical protein
LSSKDHPEPEGSGPGRESMRSGSRRGRIYPNPLVSPNFVQLVTSGDDAGGFGRWS